VTLEEFLGSVPSGIGEIGLDQSLEPLNKDAQEDVFRAQLDLARKHERPVTIHCRRAWGWLMDILKTEEIPNGFQVHAYGGSVELIAPLAEMGAYFSFGGSSLWENNHRAKDALLAIPSDRLLIETDSPAILPPEEYRTKKAFSADGKELNHPANLPVIAESIALILEKSPEALREQLWDNSKRFFAISDCGFRISEGV
jgi:TatD DNase family protein